MLFFKVLLFLKEDSRAVAMVNTGFSSVTGLDPHKVVYQGARNSNKHFLYHHNTDSRFPFDHKAIRFPSLTRQQMSPGFKLQFRFSLPDPITLRVFPSQKSSLETFSEMGAQ